MFCSSSVLPALLSLVLGLALTGSHASSLYSHSQYNVPYQGPPAPLNHDGTVAFTLEFQQANAVHNAAYAEEFKRLREVEGLAAAHPDPTSPHSLSYKDGQYNTYSQVQVNYPASHDLASQKSVQVSYNQVPSYNPQAYIPASLNYDGTIAQTPEYNAIAASLQAAHNQALTRHRRSFDLYQGPLAPLNQDGTVALTPELKQAKDEHNAAVAKEFKRLQDAANLAAAHPDLTSPTHSYTANSNKQYSNRQYNAVQPSLEISYKYNTEARIPATLNHDGTVALTSETQQAKAQHESAVVEELKKLQEADSLAAAYPDYTSPRHSYSANNEQHNAIPQIQAASYKNSLEAHIPAPLNLDGTVALTPEVHQAKAAHDAAVSEEYRRFQEAANLAAAQPDLTSPKQGYSSNNEYNAVHSSQTTSYKYNPESRVNSPLSYDGTTQVPEYNVATAAHQAEYQRNLQSVQHNQMTSYKYNPEAHIPAPLNPDGSVDQTAEYKAAAAAHQAAYQKILQSLKHQNSLDKNSQMTSYKYNIESRDPATFKHDVSVVQTGEYNGAAAAHQASYQKTHQNVKHQRKGNRY